MNAHPVIKQTDVKAFIQILWRWPLIGIIRAGEDTDRHGKPYQYAVVFRKKLFRRTVVIYALVSVPARCEGCEWHAKFRRAHVAAAIEVLGARGLDAEWERYKDEEKKTVHAPHHCGPDGHCDLENAA